MIYDQTTHTEPLHHWGLLAGVEGLKEEGCGLPRWLGESIVVEKV